MLPYRPLPLEISTFVQTAIEANPQLARRATQAAAILIQTGIAYYSRTGNWYVPSMSHPHWYTINWDGVCNCPDSKKDAPILDDGKPACKHRIAYLVYRSILLDWLHAHIDSHHLQIVATPDGDLYLATRSGDVLYVDRAYSVGILPHHGGWTFRYERDAFMYSCYLAELRGLPCPHKFNGLAEPPTYAPRTRLIVPDVDQAVIDHYAARVAARRN